MCASCLPLRCAAAAATASPLPSIAMTSSLSYSPYSWTLWRLPVPVGCRRMIYDTRVTRVTVPLGPRQSQLEPARRLRLSRSRSSQRRILIPPISSCWQPPVTSRPDPALLPVKQTQPVPALNCRLLLLLLFLPPADSSSSLTLTSTSKVNKPLRCAASVRRYQVHYNRPQHHGRARTCPNRPWELGPIPRRRQPTLP